MNHRDLIEINEQDMKAGIEDDATFDDIEIATRQRRVEGPPCPDEEKHDEVTQIQK